ncbi:MAG: NAD(+) kinase [Zoogloeaceae bacterium]|jgi:NAD+ kinase|nr:NAD(+) kinase [Zoogloeaceae bacterium]
MTHESLCPRTIALIGKHKRPEVREAVLEVADFLARRGIFVFIERETAENIGHNCDSAPAFPVANFDDIARQADLAIVLGGDGTMLSAARLLARAQVPLLGINQGRLGFMTDLPREDALSYLDDLLDGKFTPESRLLLEAEIWRGNEKRLANLALNDIVLDKGGSGRMIEFQLYIDGSFVYRLHADGLIVATPTGSTAYALSAGGPILHTALSGIVLAPLCPHALTNRPVVVGDHSLIEIVVSKADDLRVHFDGQVAFQLENSDALRIFASPQGVQFWHPPGYNYFAMLRQKLHWTEG